MRAILSGQVGLALFGNDDAVWAVSVEDQEDMTSSDWDESPYLFAGANDVIELLDVAREDIIEQLVEAWRRDRAMQLFLVFLDYEEELETRRMACECVEEHFSSSKISQYIVNRLYSVPLPASADIPRAQQIASDGKADKVLESLTTLYGHQSAIARTREAWTEISLKIFQSVPDKARFEAVAVEAGAFRIMAEGMQDGSVASAWMECLERPQIKKLANYRNVVTAWVNPLRTVKIDQRHSVRSGMIFPIRLAREIGNRIIRKSKSVKYATGFRQWPRIQKEIDTILDNIDEGHETRALKYAQQLVERQKSDGHHDYAVKTLCNLSAQMKARELHDLQMQFARWAREEFPMDVQTRDQFSDAYFCLRRLDDALASYDETIQLFPNDSVAFNGRSGVLRALGRFDEALAQYQETAQRFPDEQVAQHGLGETLRDLGRLDDALAQYEDTIRQFPDDSFAYNGRAAVLRDLGRLSEALTHYEQASLRFMDNVVARNGQGAVLRELGRMDEALTRYEKTIQQYTENSFAYNGRAEVLRDLRRFTDALSQYKETIQRWPNSAVAYCGLGEVLRNLGRLDEALAHYQDTIKRFPNSKVAQNGRAGVLRDLGRLAEAQTQCEETIRQFPHDLFACNLRAEILRDLGQFTDALSQYEQSIQRCPFSEVAYCGRGEVLRDLGRVKEALAQYQEIIQKFRTDRVAANGHASVLSELGRDDEALTLYEETIQQHPYDTYAYIGLGGVLRRLGRLDDALAQYDDAMARFPTNRVAPNAKASVLTKLKMYDQALLLLADGPPTSHDDWKDLHVRGMIHLHRNEYDLASKLFDKGIRDCPFSVSVSYFRNALAITRLGQREYAKSVAALGNDEGEVTDVLRLHAEYEQGHTKRANIAHDRLRNSQRPRVTALRDRLARAFGADGSSAVIRNDDWYEVVHEQEFELVAYPIAA